jgi:hypothetical protein
MEAETTFERRYRAATPHVADPRPRLCPEVLVTPSPSVKSGEEYSSADKDDPAWHRDVEDRRGPLFAEDVPLFFMPSNAAWTPCTRWMTDERPLWGEQTTSPHLAGTDSVMEDTCTRCLEKWSNGERVGKRSSARHWQNCLVLRTEAWQGDSVARGVEGDHPLMSGTEP